MKLKNILFSLVAIVLSFFAVTAKAETTAPSYYELDGSNLHKIDVSYYLSNSTINMEFKKTTDGQIVYCTERSKTFYTGRAKYYLIGEMDQRIVYLFQNGYPNKTIFGNADKDYLTTGLAVWYLINPNDYSFQHFDLEKGTYRGKDSDIVREMAKLVNGANNYKQAEPTIKLNGNTNLTLSSDGKYYVSSNLGITTTGNVKDSYTVSLEGAPSGTIITNVNGKEQNTFSKNEKFIVKVPVSSIKGTTLNFKVNAAAEGGIAKVYEYKPSDSRYQGTSGLYYDYKNINTSLELKLNIVTEVQISKIDATTNKELPGAHLVVKDANGKVIDEWTSTEEVHVIKGLNPGKYTLTETIAPEGYVLSTETITFEVKNDGTVTKVVMKNYLEDKPIPVSISKRDITTGEELPGAHLELKDETGEVIYAWVSTNEPFIIKDGLKPGKYTLSEMIAPEGYELSTETVTFVVKEDVPAAAPAESCPACGSGAAIAIQLFNRLQHRWIAYRKICRSEQYSKPVLAIEPDEFFFHLRLGQPFLCNAGLQFLPLLFQSFQPLLGGTGQNAHLDSVQHIGDADFRFLQLLFVDGQIRAFLILQFHDFGNDGIHGSVIFHQLHGLVDHQIFQPLFPHGLFIAGLFLLGCGTLVIGVHLPGVADTAFSEHQRSALTAVQLGGEQIGILCLMTGRGLFIFCQLFLQSAHLQFE